MSIEERGNYNFIIEHRYMTSCAWRNDGGSGDIPVSSRNEREYVMKAYLLDKRRRAYRKLFAYSVVKWWQIPADFLRCTWIPRSKQSICPRRSEHSYIDDTGRARYGDMLPYLAAKLFQWAIKPRGHRRPVAKSINADEACRLIAPV